LSIQIIGQKKAFVKFTHIFVSDPFKNVFYNGKNWTPGISYSVPWNEVMVAVAPGAVTSIKTLNTGRAGGEVVRINYL